ncbi:MAG: putative manganese-dependent inorganic diphosphatase [Bacilli bacterium]|nr:putative manganese-dependent inorganic diphosphatase [Bacilli bacterium]
MALTYIFGHKNPDTDSVCSSIALSYLRNELGGKTVPRVLGDINNETKFVLKYFGVDAPSYLNDVKVRIKNIKFDKKAFIHEEASLDQAFKLMQKQNVTAIPLVNDKKLLTGYVTLKEIARYLINGDKEKIHTTLDNIIDTLEAKVITRFDDMITGNILVAGMKSTVFYDTISLSNEDILIVGDRHRILNYAIDSKVKLIILPLNSTIEKKLLVKARKREVTIIETAMSSFQISNRILLSNYIRNINTNTSPVTVLNDDYFSDFKQMSHKINHTNYPVINKKGECLGLIRLTGPNSYEKQKVILVDHNNLEQSVDGIEEAEILEIIDHHNLGAIGTSVPINFISRPVGCTSTMLYDMFVENKIDIPRSIAGLLLSAILSDTLLLTSPTTTEDDRFVAVKLAKLAKVDMDKYGVEMLKAASSIKNMSIEGIIKSDFKSFNVNNRHIGIGQVMTMDFDFIKENMDAFITRLNLMVEADYDFVFLFITDIIKKGSYVLFNDSAANVLKDSFGLKTVYEGVFLPKVVSRKKQMLPSIMSTLEANNIE